MSYPLWHWPDLSGRGDFVRLPTEAARIARGEPPREAENGFAMVRRARHRPAP